MLPRSRLVSRFAALGTGLVLLCSFSRVMGAQPTPTRISSRVTLSGSTHPLAQPRNEQGPADAAANAERLRVMLTRSTDREKALRQFLDATRDAHSLQYRKRLTPEQYGLLFGATDSQIGTVSDWLKSQGFAVTRIPASKTYVEFSGQVGTVEKAFATSLKGYVASGDSHTANASPLSIPSSLAPYISGIAPLNSFRATAQVRTASTPTKLISKTATPAPALRDPTKGTIFITPADAATIYNLPNAFNQHAPGGTRWDGTGVRIGIAGYSDLEHDDYLRYRRRMLHETNPPDAVDVIDGIDPGKLDQHDGQVTLAAAEIASGMAPGAQIYIYSSQSDLLDNGYINAITRAIEDNSVDILELSYSICEYYLGPSGNAQVDELWKQAAAQGITVVVAAGDAGSAACDAGNENAVTGLAVNGLASSPYVLAVGGTDFDVPASDFAQYFANASAPAYQTALKSYVPESVWDDALQNLNNVSSDADHAAGYGSLVSASGGGASAYAICSGGYDANGDCQGYRGYSQPPFQANTGIGATTRTIPDISLFAGTNRTYGATWAICSDTATAQAAQLIDECDTPAADGSFSVEGAGGTGTAAPAFAGMLALLLQSQRLQEPDLRLGLAANGLYNLNQIKPDIFHDISSGNNSVPCAGGQDCGRNGFLLGQDAGPGYDMASGLGSVDMGALINAWPTISYASTALNLQAGTLSSIFSTDPVSVTHGDTVQFKATVTPNDVAGSAAITGIASMASLRDLAVNEVINLADGSGVASTSKLPGGSYSVRAYYAGDATHGPAESEPLQINVEREASTLRITTELQQSNPTNSGPIVQNPASFAYGTYGFVFVQPVGRHEPSGRATGHVHLLNGGVMLSADGSPSDQILNSLGRVAYPFNRFAPGSYSLTAAYDGDASYTPSQTTTPMAFTISKALTRLTAQSSAASMDASASVTINATLATDSTGAYPSGDLSVIINGVDTGMKYAVGQGRRLLALNNSDIEIFTFVVPNADFPSGINALQVIYGGDDNYIGTNKMVGMVSSAAATPASFSMEGPRNGITLPVSRRYVAALVTLQSLNGFSGTIHLTCAWKSSTAPNTASCDIPPSATLRPYSFAYPFLTVIGQPTPYDGPHTISRFERGMGGIALCSVLLLLRPIRKSSVYILLLLPATLAVFGMLGCGSQSTHAQGRQAGTFTAIVTGVSGAITMTTEVSVHID